MMVARDLKDVGKGEVTVREVFELLQAIVERAWPPSANSGVQCWQCWCGTVCYAPAARCEAPAQPPQCSSPWLGGGAARRDETVGGASPAAPLGPGARLGPDVVGGAGDECGSSQSPLGGAEIKDPLLKPRVCSLPISSGRGDRVFGVDGCSGYSSVVPDRCERGGGIQGQQVSVVNSFAPLSLGAAEEDEVGSGDESEGSSSATGDAFDRVKQEARRAWQARERLAARKQARAAK